MVCLRGICVTAELLFNNQLRTNKDSPEENEQSFKICCHPSKSFVSRTYLYIRQEFLVSKKQSCRKNKFQRHVYTERRSVQIHGLVKTTTNAIIFTRNTWCFHVPVESSATGASRFIQICLKRNWPLCEVFSKLHSYLSCVNLPASFEVHLIRKNFTRCLFRIKRDPPV